MAWESLESSMATALYAALGQVVTYTALDSAAQTIYAIVDDASQLFGFENETAERTPQARVKTADVTTPRRGDLITMASGLVYEVDSVDKENNVEWLLRLTERDR